MPGDITSLLHAVSAGDQSAWEGLIPLVYQELKNLARSSIQKQHSNHSLQATELVHEVFMRFVGAQGVAWSDRTHFYRAATMAMNWILLDYTRHRKRAGGSDQRAFIPLDSVRAQKDPRTYLKKLEVLDIALRRLEANENMARKCKIVNMHFFLGMTFEEIARALDIAVRTVKYDWQFARAWLLREVQRIESYGV